MIGTKLPRKGKEGVVIPSFRSIGLERKGCLKKRHRDSIKLRNPINITNKRNWSP